MRIAAPFCLLAAALGAAPPAIAASCRIESAPHRVTIVDLYTSEGCSSCPPADRWLSRLAAEGITPEQAIPLAWHVDYWNQLGWPDRFSQPGFSERQRRVAGRGGTGFVYTPQVVVDGRDFRPVDTARLRSRVARINAEKSTVRIEADAAIDGATLRVRGSVNSTSPGQAWIAVFENGLSTEVRAGENAGARLNHDYVVRRLAGPFAFDARGQSALDWNIELPADWNRARLGIAVFADDASGAVLGAAASRASCGT
jgi:hypothetical protein